MPGVRCAVVGCQNSLKKTKTIDSSIRFHRFPKNADLRAKWIEKCKNPTNFNPDTGRICSLHFTKNDYERDLKNELLGLPLKPNLKPTAIPDEDIHAKTDNVIPIQPQLETMGSSTKTNKSNINRSNVNVNSNSESSVNSNVNDLYVLIKEPEYKRMKSEHEELVEQYNNLLSTKKEMEKKLLYFEMLEVEQNKKIRILQNNLLMERKKNSPKAMQERIQTILSGFLTKNQINMIVNKKSKVHWTVEEIATALTLLHGTSKKCYIFLQQKLNYPLPALSTIRRWLTQEKNGKQKTLSSELMEIPDELMDLTEENEV